MGSALRIVLETWNLADAARIIAIEALTFEGSVEAAAKAMGITPNALKRMMDAHGIEDPTPTSRASRKKVRSKAQGKARKA